MKCSVCGVDVGSGAAWGPCAKDGHLNMVCSSCAVAPETRAAPKTVASTTPSMLGRIRASSAAISVDKLVTEPASRKALVAALVAGHVLLIDGGRIISAQ